MSDSAQYTWDDLYRDHCRWLQGWLRRRLRCPEDAADLTHDTYARIIRSRRMPTRDQSRPFLRQVAQGLAIDLHRRRVLERAYLEALARVPEEQAPSAERRALVLETLVAVDRVLDGLPARVRETFLLSQFEGLTYAAIAARLGVSVAAVRKYMLKAVTACVAALGAPSVDEAL